MHPINKALDKNEPKKPCDKNCKYYKFDHLEVPCVLSEVYSVNKGDPCAIYAEQPTQEYSNGQSPASTR